MRATNIILEEMIEEIYRKSPLQKKKLSQYFENQDQQYFNLFSQFLKDYNGYLESQNIDIKYAIDAYLKMCKDMVKSQIYFLKTDKYPIVDAKEAYDKVYNNKDAIKSYMIGLALSQFLWKTHYQMFTHLKDAMRKNNGQISSYLEIGPGHGLFLKEAIQTLGKEIKFSAVDISQTSIEITKSIIHHFFNDSVKINYFIKDMLQLDITRKYDFITMGEVLEHVDKPSKLLNKFESLLSHKGKGFISTCVNCPTIDHVYQFESVDEIREIIADSKLSIYSEMVLPVEELPMEEIINNKITINYCAIVELL